LKVAKAFGNVERVAHQENQGSVYFSLAIDDKVETPKTNVALGVKHVSLSLLAIRIMKNFVGNAQVPYLARHLSLF
jgi:hypothetical protein